MLKTLLEMGNLGQKTKAGFYKKAGRDVLRFDLASKDYVPGGEKADEVYGRMLKKPAGRAPEAAAQRAKARRASSCGPSCATASTTPPCTWRPIAETARDVDFAMRWGFGMKQGPFELWQEAGWLQVAQWIQEDIDAGKALSKAPLPEWVFKGPVAEAGGVHTPEGSWNPTAKQVRAAPRAAGVRAPAFPRDRAGQQRAAASRRPARRCTRTTRSACGRWTTKW